jgi:hypothetical protein
MSFAALGEKSSQSGDSFDALRDEKNRKVCLMSRRQG